jgi:hypothetical protein
MSNPYRDRLLGVGYLSKGRTQSRVKEGREHPETGVPFKATTDELGNTVTEHAVKGDRQDVAVRPATVRAVYSRSAGRLENLS